MYIISHVLTMSRGQLPALGCGGDQRHGAQPGPLVVRSINQWRPSNHGKIHHFSWDNCGKCLCFMEKLWEHDPF